MYLPIRILLAPLLLGLLALPSTAEDKKSDIKKHTDAANAAKKAGNHQDAIDYLDKAIDLHRQMGQKGDEAKLAFQAAQSLSALASKQPAGLDKDQRKKQLGYYLTVGEHGSPADKKVASTYLKDAVTQFEKSKEPTRNAHVYYYTWGRALEVTGRTVEAQNQYWKALEKIQTQKAPTSSGFEKTQAMKPTTDRLVGLLIKEKEGARRYEQADKLLVSLMRPPNTGPTPSAVDHETVNLAGKYVYQFLDAWGGQAQSESLYPRLLDYLDLSHVGPVEFEKREAPELNKLNRHPSVASKTEELKQLYSGSALAARRPPLYSDSNEVLKVFPQWREVLIRHRDATGAFSHTMKHAADYYYRRSLPDLPAKTKHSTDGQQVNKAEAARHALARYSAAFTLDPHNSEAAIYAVSTVSEHGKELDKPDKLLESLREAIFDAKMGLYARATTREDWDAIYRCHLVLAGIAESQTKWGPPERTDSAIYHLKRALDAEKRLHVGPDRNQPPIGWLNDRLARAYEAAEKPADAAKAYLLAANGFLYTRNLKQASSALEAFKRIADADPSDWGPGLREAERLSQLAANMTKLIQLDSVNTTGIVSVAFLPDGKQLLWAERNRAKIWIPEKKSGPTIPISKETLQALALAPSGKEFACTWTTTVELWSVESKARLRQIESDATVAALAFSRDGGILAGGASDKVTLWDKATGAARRRIAVPQGAVKAVAFSPTADILAVAAANNVLILDAASGQNRYSPLKDHKGAVTALAFKSDGNLLASGSADRTIRLWDVATGQLRATLLSNRTNVTALAFSPDGRRLLAGFSDGAAILYDVSEARKPRELAWLTPFRGNVASVSFSLDGKRVALGLSLPGNSGEVQVWDVHGLTE
jgi:tetratricopeptide (TPR) repeat protein